MGRVFGFGPSQDALYPDKQFRTVQARAYLIKDASLVRIEDDYGDELFVLSRLNVVRHLRTLADVETCLERWERRG